MLNVTDINVYYGAIHALKGLSFHVEEGEIVSLIGANGAGKTTTMQTISGLLRSKTGDITFMESSIFKTEPHKIVALGLAQVPEGRRIFGSLTVQENLEMGAFSRKYTAAKMRSLLEEQYAVYPRLKERRKQAAGTLSGGEQQMLAIARGMMSEPKMIMFDEPSLGLAPVIVDEMFDVIVSINRDKHIPVILVEQNAYAALGISQRCYVLENGEIKMSGNSAELREMHEIKKAYLGG